MKIKKLNEFNERAPQKYEYLVKLLEEYLDPDNTMDENLKVKVTRSTNRTAEAKMFIEEMNLLSNANKYNL